MANDYEIAYFLEENKIKFEREKRFEWLKDKHNLRADFFLTDFNCIIECQGIQHFKDVQFDGTQSFLKDVTKRDKIKYELCKEHGIKIYYYAKYHIDFPYYVYEDKEKMINDIKYNNF